MIGRRHPSRVQLAAWFDGEAPEGLGWHLVGCASCFAHLRTLAGIRAALRAHAVAAALSTAPGALPPRRGPGPAGGPDPSRPRPSRPAGVAVPHRWRRAGALAAVPAVLVLLACLLVAGVVPSPLHSTLSSVATHPGASGHALGAPGASAGAGTTGPAPPGATAANGTGAPSTGSPGGPGAPPGQPGRPGGLNGPLRLALVVPTRGAGATEGREVTEAVQKAVALADAAGGVGGAPVALTVVAAEDPAGVSALSGRVDAVIGGFGAQVPGSVPWVLPADPSASGDDAVPAELSPAETGTRLGEDLVRRGVTGTVGVVVGSGPDAALAQGLAGVVPVSTVDVSSGDDCLPALSALEGHVTAVAVAGPPDLAGACVAALALMAWQPSGGLLLAPSAVYAGVPATLAAGPVLSVLGLPWPTAPSAGAATFRSAVPGVRSYRALVSFAAAELAVQVARTTGALGLADVGRGIWSTDLYDFAGFQNAGAQVVEDSAGSWVTAP
ncbi:MAG: hypothetical protein KGJ77_03235 [Acidobacteriota bacterium]|nr:hypothetical protein [Acidobacteriota bacterium]